MRGWKLELSSTVTCSVPFNNLGRGCLVNRPAHGEIWAGLLLKISKLTLLKMAGFFEPLNDPDPAPAKLTPRAHPWSAAIDGAAPVPAAVRGQLGWGQSMI